MELCDSLVFHKVIRIIRGTSGLRIALGNERLMSIRLLLLTNFGNRRGLVCLGVCRCLVRILFIDCRI